MFCLVFLNQSQPLGHIFQTKYQAQAIVYLIQPNSHIKTGLLSHFKTVNYCSHNLEIIIHHHKAEVNYNEADTQLQTADFEVNFHVISCTFWIFYKTKTIVQLTTTLKE